ncbi:MAG: preprotein translocase subunit YajC [Phycisphaerae bacterium]
MRLAKTIAVVLAAAVALAALPAWAQTTQPAVAPMGEELKPAPSTPAAAPGGTLSQTATTGPAGPEGAAKPKGMFGGDQTMLFVLMGMLVILFVWSSRSRKKQEQKRQQMLSSLKKGDKVTSIGGIVGTIIEVRDDEVLVKVDETNNVRMRFARWAIRGTGEEAKTQAPEQK